MFNEQIKKSKHFVKYTDKTSGVESFIFTDDYVPHTQSFYFTNPSMTDDMRYMWMYCAFPPAGSAAFGRSLGVVDFENDTFTYFPNTIFFDASPIVDTKTGYIYWCNHKGLYRRSPDPRMPIELIAKTPSEFSKKGYFIKTATHMTFSPDKTSLCFDAHVGNHFIFGDINISSGEFTTWHEFDYAKNHAQLNPVIPDMMLFAEDGWSEVDTGKQNYIRYDENGKLMRLWTMKKGEEPVYIPPLFVEARHEWWGPDGNSIYYVDWVNGTIKYDMKTKEHTVIDPKGTWHTHCSADETLFVADSNKMCEGEMTFSGCPFRGCESKVHFFNKNTGKYVNIITENPALYSSDDECQYHIDPHPQFTAKDKLIMHTTTVTGRVSAAITDVSELIERTK